MVGNNPWHETETLASIAPYLVFTNGEWKIKNWGNGTVSGEISWFAIKEY